MTTRLPVLLPVVHVTRWTGFCLPCASEDRPLVLTWTGRRGLRAWLAGDTWSDGTLLLTCTTCGGTDPVGWAPEAEPEPEVEAPVLASVPVDAGPDAPEHERLVRPGDLQDDPASAVPRLGPLRVVDLRRLHRRGPEQTPAAPTGAADGDALDLLHLAG